MGGMGSSLMILGHFSAGQPVNDVSGWCHRDKGLACSGPLQGTQYQVLHPRYPTNMTALNPAINAPVLLALTNTLREVSKELANLTAAPAPKPHNRIAHLTNAPRKGVPKQASRIPELVSTRLHNSRAAELVRREEVKLAKTAQRAKPAKPKNPVNHMTPEIEADILLLLTKTTMSVVAISQLYGYSRAAIYGLRDRNGLTVRRGSAALMAGIKRAKAKKAAAKARVNALVETPKAPVPEPQVETPIAATA